MEKIPVCSGLLPEFFPAHHLLPRRSLRVSLPGFPSTPSYGGWLGRRTIPQAWLYGVLNNKINLRFRDIYKTAEKETSFDDREYELPYADDLIDKKIDEVYNSEIKNRLQKLLSSDEYELIKAIHFEKLKMKEAAERFGSTESAVKQKHYRICRKLRKIIGSPEDLI